MSFGTVPLEELFDKFLPKDEVPEATQEELRRALRNAFGEAIDMFDPNHVEEKALQKAIGDRLAAIAIVAIRSAQAHRFGFQGSKVPLQSHPKITHFTPPVADFKALMNQLLSLLALPPKQDTMLRDEVAAIGALDINVLNAAKLPVDDCAARLIRMYTISIDLPDEDQFYAMLNNAVMHRVNLDPWLPVLFYLDSAIHKLCQKSTPIKAYRRCRTPANAERLVEGGVVTFARINSFSTEEAEAKNFNGHYDFEAELTCYASISSLSGYQTEAEVIAPVCTMFRILAVEDTASGRKKVVMDQLPVVPLFETNRSSTQSKLGSAMRSAAELLKCSDELGFDTIDELARHPTLFVVGATNAGKSLLCNQLLQAHVFPALSGPCTAIAAEAIHDEACIEPTLLKEDHEVLESLTADISGAETVHDFIDNLADEVRARGLSAKPTAMGGLTIRCRFPAALLESGVSRIVDLPGTSEVAEEGGDRIFDGLLEHNVGRAAVVAHVVRAEQLAATDPYFFEHKHVADVVAGAVASRCAAVTMVLNINEEDWGRNKRRTQLEAQASNRFSEWYGNVKGAEMASIVAKGANSSASVSNFVSQLDTQLPLLRVKLIRDKLQMMKTRLWDNVAASLLNQEKERQKYVAALDEVWRVSMNEVAAEFRRYKPDEDADDVPLSGKLLFLSGLGNVHWGLPEDFKEIDAIYKRHGIDRSVKVHLFSGRRHLVCAGENEWLKKRINSFEKPAKVDEMVKATQHLHILSSLCDALLNH